MLPGVYGRGLVGNVPNGVIHGIPYAVVLVMRMGRVAFDDDSDPLGLYEGVGYNNLYNECYWGIADWSSIRFGNFGVKLQSLMLGRWCVYVMRNNADLDRMEFWIDGVLRAQRPGCDTMGQYVTATPDMVDIGGGEQNMGGCFIGDVAEIRLYDGTVTDAALASLMAGLASAWNAHGALAFTWPTPTTVDLPAGLASGLVAWLDAADHSTQFADAAGTVPAVDNGQVQCWLDKSGAVDPATGAPFRVVTQHIYFGGTTSGFPHSTAFVRDEAERVQGRSVLMASACRAYYNVRGPLDLLTAACTRVMVFRAVLNDTNGACPLSTVHLADNSYDAWYPRANGVVVDAFDQGTGMWVDPSLRSRWVRLGDPLHPHRQTHRPSPDDRGVRRRRTAVHAVPHEHHLRQRLRLHRTVQFRLDHRGRSAGGGVQPRPAGVRLHRRGSALEPRPGHHGACGSARVHRGQVGCHHVGLIVASQNKTKKHTTRPFYSATPVILHHYVCFFFGTRILCLHHHRTTTERRLALFLFVCSKHVFLLTVYTCSHMIFFRSLAWLIPDHITPCP